jgi:hypothetical protein
MTRESRPSAGILLILLPTVMYGGLRLLPMLMNDPSVLGVGLLLRAPAK